jgi:hypothetical protein
VQSHPIHEHMAARKMLHVCCSPVPNEAACIMVAMNGENFEAGGDCVLQGSMV